MSHAGANLSARKAKVLPAFEKAICGKGALDFAKLEALLKKVCDKMPANQIEQVIDAAVKSGVQTNEQFLPWLFGEAPITALQNGNGMAELPASDTSTKEVPAAEKAAADVPSAAQPPSDVEKPSAEKPAVDVPAAEKLATTDLPATGKLAAELPVADKPAMELPGADKPAAELLVAGKSALTPENALVHASFSANLQQLLSEHPYLQPGGSLWPHPLQYWVSRCHESIEACKFEEAQEYYHRVTISLEADKKQITEAFRRFDYNGSGQIDTSEMRHMCAYLGWGEEEAALMDLDKDGQVTLHEFQAFIGRLGGIQQLFAHRRLRISTSRRDVCDYAGIAVGARVRAHYYVHGHKSRSWREAQVLGVGIERRPEGMGPATLGVLLEFVFGPVSMKTKKQWSTRQVVPPHWVLSSVEDASVAAALREVGILDDHQAFWALLLPETEMLAIERLENCQRVALKAVRDQATACHEKDLPKLQENFSKLGYGEREMQAALSWIQDLAPVVVHVHLDRMGAFMEVDEFYRNQFETKTSCGALDDKNATRTKWEHDLFAGAYDGAKPFDRCKYGALNVMNDYRGVVSARQYGDSYLVLKDVRLRCTFASTDSGGIAGSRLAVMDKYAHVLSEYSDEELKGLVSVAMAAQESGGDDRSAQPELLRGSTADATMEWVTYGFPKLQQDCGQYYFEVEVDEGSGTAQVGLLSSTFKCQPCAASAIGVGDDEHGWAVDGQNAALWHKGQSRAWEQSWPSVQSPPQYYNPWSPAPNTKPARILSKKVVVGVAVDFGTRQVCFSADGQWAQSPAFTADDISEGAALYPAVSIQGRACFNFGPEFSYAPPDAEKREWPDAPRRKVRIDNPRLGNEETLRIYKEAQIHGELSLKRNVQRLVACRKYRDAPKTLRSWGLRAIGGARCAGAYTRAGAHGGKPLYRNASDAIIYWDAETQKWRMSDAGPEDFTSWFCQVPGDGSSEPPRRGWQVPDDERGHISVDVFRKACEAASLQAWEVDRLCTVLSVKSSEGPDMFFRVRGYHSLEFEWGRLSTPTMTPDEVWALAITESQREIREKFGLPEEAVVIQTSHPYAANRHSFKKEVQIEGAPGLVVHFYRNCCTLDRRARFRAFTGGLRRADAGPGARVELACHATSGSKVWGTVANRSSDGVWMVQLDRRQPAEEQAEEKEGEAAESTWRDVGAKVEARHSSGRWYGATVAEVRDGGVYLVDWEDGDSSDREKTRDALRRPDAAAKSMECRDVEDLSMYASVAKDGEVFASCTEEPNVLVVDYTGDPSKADEQGYVPVVGDEIASFALDRSFPASPFKVKGFSRPGPAQEQGVGTGWFLDLISSVRINPKMVDLFNGVGGATMDDPHNQINLLLDHLFNHVDEVLTRLNIGLRSFSDVQLVFSNSSSPSTPVLLPEARASYKKKQKIGDEIAKLGVEKGRVQVESFATQGPAHAAGVRTGWEVDFDHTVFINPQPPQALPSKKAFDADPSVLLSVSGITVVFKQPYSKSTQLFQASGAVGQGRWKSCSLPGDTAEFEFSTDGDGGDQPDKRWGVFAVVVPKALMLGVKEEQEFIITINKSDGTPLGVTVQRVASGESSCLLVQGSDEAGKGLAYTWNAANPDKEIRSSDRFIEINGVKGDADKMLEELQKDVVLTIKVQRCSGPLCNEGHMLDEMELPWNRCDLCGTYGTHYHCSQDCNYDLCQVCHGQSQSGPLQPAGFNEFADKYIEATQNAVGVQDLPEVERDGWDEQRLRALCRRHGWEFEWMTEDGERRRRAHECQGRLYLAETARGKLLLDADPAEPDATEQTPGEAAQPVAQARSQELVTAEAENVAMPAETVVMDNEAADVVTESKSKAPAVLSRSKTMEGLTEDCVKFKNLSDADIKMVLFDSEGCREVWILSGMSTTPVIRDWSVQVTPNFNDEGKLPMTIQGGSVYVVRFEAGVVTCKLKDR